jgi:hypothetical protein
LDESIATAHPRLKGQAPHSSGPPEIKLLDFLYGERGDFVAIFFRITPSWLKHVEKVYFDAVLEAYTPSERKECREVLRIV